MIEGEFERARMDRLWLVHPELGLVQTFYGPQGSANCKVVLSNGFTCWCTYKDLRFATANDLLKEKL